MINAVLPILKREYSYTTNKPYIGALELTYRCNCRCSTCNVWKLSRSKDEELSLAEIKHSIDQMKRLNIKKIVLVGAEPFMREDILPIINYIKSSNLECGITTNSAALNEHIIRELCNCGLDTLNISIDGIGESHDLMRSHRGLFDKAVKTIGYLKQIRQDLGKNKPAVYIHTTLSNINISEIRKIWCLKEKIGVDNIGFSYACQTKEQDYFASVYKGKNIASSRVLLEGKALNFSNDNIMALKKVVNEMEQEGIKLPFSLKSLSRWSYKNLEQADVPVSRCYAVRNMITINPYGDVLPCTNLDGFKYGNIKEESLSDILKSSERKQFLKRLDAGFFPACKSCTNFSLTFRQIIKVLMNKLLKGKEYRDL